MNLRVSALLRAWGRPAGAAAICMLLGAACTYAFLLLPALAIEPVRPVVVTTRDLARGDVLSRGALDFRELPERYLEERHVAGDDLERVLGGKVSAALGSGSALLWSDLSRSPAERTLSRLVQTGMRGVQLRAHDAAFAGLLRPGDRVDVLFTPNAGAAGTLVESALVLSIGRDLGDELDSRRDADEDAAITLAVTREQAQQLAESEGRGVHRLALRNPEDVVLAAEPLARAGVEP